MRNQWKYETSAPRQLFKLVKRIKKASGGVRIDKRGKHTKKSRLLRIELAKKSLPEKPTCNNCQSILDLTVTTREGDAVVCKNCGVVDGIPIFDEETPTIDCRRGSPLYRHRNYFAERILQARNEEPRFRDEELDILSHIYDIYRNSSLLFWNEKFFSKKHCAIICRHLIKVYPNSIFTRRIERWYQYRIYICGNTGNHIPDDIAFLLRALFDAYSHYFEKALKYEGSKKSNITQLDLVILVLLYSIDPKLVNEYGWYFLNHNLINRTPSIFKNYEKIITVCDLVNERILKEFNFTVPVTCYQWFRLGKKFATPDLEDLINAALSSQLGAAQYANYCKNNKMGAYRFYIKNMS